MPDFLKSFDGSGRKPRKSQIDGLQWLSDNWHKSDRFCINAPVGSGKSAMARAIARITRGHVITPSNLLINQYIADYPHVNFLKGKTHYQCQWGVSCSDWQDVAGQPACETCPYKECKTAAIRGEPTFFNPMSLYYTATHRDWEEPQVLIVDEAHQLNSMMLMLSGAKLRKSVFKYPTNSTSELVLIPWLADQISRYQKLALFHKDDASKLKEVTDELQSLRMTHAGLSENAQNYAIFTEKGVYRGRPEEFLNLKPLRPPQFIINRILQGRKIILMSGTLVESDIKDLFNEKSYLYLDLPSPIPKENRAISYAPVGFKLNRSTDPAIVVRAIESIVAQYPERNTIIHVSYSNSKRLAPHFILPILVNDQKNKDKVLAKFKAEGGIFLAAGCAEGIDLKDDLCRLNIIPQLSFPNLLDCVVKKRKALADGAVWYALETLKTTIQQAGRSTRGIDDHSITVIMDPNFGWVFRMVKHKLPQSFKEVIKWGTSAHAT